MWLPSGGCRCHQCCCRQVYVSSVKAETGVHSRGMEDEHDHTWGVISLGHQWVEGSCQGTVWAQVIDCVYGDVGMVVFLYLSLIGWGKFSGMSLQCLCGTIIVCGWLDMWWHR